MLAKQTTVSTHYRLENAADPHFLDGIDRRVCCDR